MKKVVTIVMAFVLLSLLPNGSGMQVAAAGEGQQYLAMDFENGWDPSGCTVGENSTATWTNRDTFCGSQGSLEFSTTRTFGAIQFPLTTLPGNTYDISFWVRFKETPKVQNATFIIYTPKKDGTGNCWNQFAANHTENFVAGKWVKVTARYTADGQGTISVNGVGQRVDCLSDGTISFRVGEGVPANLTDSGTLAYTMDDFFVIPSVTNRIDDKELIRNGGFATETQYSDAWRISSTNAATVTNLSGDGANDTTGAIQVRVNSVWGGIYTKDTMPFVFGRKYKLSFWIKAMNDESTSHSPSPIVRFMGSYDGLGEYHELRYGGAPNLTREWQYYEYTFSVNAPAGATNPPEGITIGFRVGSNAALQGGARPVYAIDEVSLKQTGEATEYNMSVKSRGNINQTGLRLNFANEKVYHGSYVYRLMRRTAQGEYCIQSGKTTLPSAYIHVNKDVKNSELRLEAFAINYAGEYSRVLSSTIADDPMDDIATLRPDNYLWNDDIDTLGATLTYDNKSSEKRVKTIAALYDADGKLLCAEETTKSIGAEDKDTCTVSISTEPTAVKARFFAWFEDTIKPITYECEITKTTEGEFIYVDSESAVSKANGSFERPYKTISRAQNALRNKLTLSAERDFYIVLKSGEYHNTDVNGAYVPIEIGEGDYAQDKNVVFTSLTSERASISGGLHISDFRIYDAGKGIYRASVPAGTKTRQLYVNGIKATRARSAEDVKGFINLDIGSAGSAFSNLGIDQTDVSFPKFKYPTEIEFVFIDQWRYQYIMPDMVTTREDGTVHYGFLDGKNKAAWQAMCRDTAPVTHPVFVENALELLDEEGEWYLDTHDNYLYYKPRYFEEIAVCDVVIPASEGLVKVTGTISDRVQNIQFRNLDFEYSGWNYPTTNRSYANNQNASHMHPSGSALMDAALELKNVTGITVDNCDFNHIGSIALKMNGAAQQCNIIGNEFFDISGTAIAVGDHDATYWNVRYPGDSLAIKDNLIANNYVHKVGTDYQSAAAVSAGFPVNTTIRNNELVDGPYCGIHTGWGWGSTAAVITRDFVIEKNYIHDFMNGRVYDGGGIYTLGNTGGTAENPNIIRENYLEDIKSIPGVIYPDEGSTFWKITKNVIDQSEYPTASYGHNDTVKNINWLHIHTYTIKNNTITGNYSTTANYLNNGVNISYQAPSVHSPENWPAEALKIIENAGIERQYKNRFDFDIQSVNVENLAVSVGETQAIHYAATTSKGQPCDLSKVEVRAKSNDTSVATVTNGNITGISAGKTWVTLSFCRKENGKVTYYDEFTFRVTVQ